MEERNLEIIDAMFDMLVDEFGYLTTIDTLANDYGLELTSEEKEYLTRGKAE